MHHTLLYVMYVQSDNVYAILGWLNLTSQKMEQDGEMKLLQYII